MSGRQGGKLKPLKAPKKEKRDEDEEDAAFKARKKAEADALKAARDKALSKGGPLGGSGGIKKCVVHFFNKGLVFICFVNKVWKEITTATRVIRVDM
ncbi:TMA7-domain-containing protein [Gymnopus androsaceus JB14]|uniref:TMA7-domain-containing protein n=1 Tax=Gymnopus androsaceus JB14 TaxID=1447944 RepID=A0A6A4I8U9_9AGAR|nr:TMA7-domain-containing protein [Gymnopus androsaceus JB14]